MLLLVLFILGSFGSKLFFNDDSISTEEEETCPLIYSSSSTEDHILVNNQPIQIVEDAGFYKFDFGEGNSGNFARQSFYFSNPLFTQVRLFDCYESGDKFLLHDSLSLLTYPATAGCDSLPFRYHSSDPVECMAGMGMWCNTGWIILTPGYHNLTIEIVTSPYLGGVGFIILQQLCIVDTNLIPCCDLNGRTCNYSMAPTVKCESSSSIIRSISNTTLKNY